MTKSLLIFPKEQPTETMHGIGDLVYLSGNDIGRTKKDRRKKKDERKKKREEKKKSGGGVVKRTLKKVAKVGLTPSRAAFLTVVTLNAGKLATKLVRIYNKPNGQESLKKFWVGKFQGDWEKLKDAMRKGSKQHIGAVTVAAAAAAAIPIVAALVPLIKSFKAEGDAAEASGFAKFLGDGYKELETNPDFEKGNVNMPDGENTALVKPEGEGMDTTTMLVLGGAAAAGLYFATRK